MSRLKKCPVSMMYINVVANKFTASFFIHIINIQKSKNKTKSSFFLVKTLFLFIPSSLHLIKRLRIRQNLLFRKNLLKIYSFQILFLYHQFLLNQHLKLQKIKCLLYKKI